MNFSVFVPGIFASSKKRAAGFRIDPAAAMIISHTLARIDTGEVDINEHIMSDGFGF